MNDQNKFDAFISYSHSNVILAERVSKRIRRYRAPSKANLKKQHLTVFRDVERLTASSMLSEELKKNVEASRYLILLASPESAKSDYVNEEVNVFIQKKSINNLIIVLIDGEFSYSLSSNLLKSIHEPLYIDIRKTNYKNFRSETLRIIAALFGVDYNKLKREDEILQRKKRNALILGILLIIFLVASIFLINSVEPETWISIPQSQKIDNLMPVHEIAVNKEDPSIILYKGVDANWATNPVPEGYSFKEVGAEPYESNNWVILHEQMNKYFKNKLNNEVKAIARLEFKINEEYYGQKGSGVVNFYPAFSPNNKLIYLKTLKYEGTTDNGETKDLMLQATLSPTDENRSLDPFDLYPWPVDTMEKLKLYSYSNIKTSFINFLTNKRVITELEPWAADEGFWEWTEIWNPENVVFSNRDSESLIIGGDTLNWLENEDDLWFSIVKDNQWITNTNSTKLNLGSINYEYDDDDEEIDKIIQQIPKAYVNSELKNQILDCVPGLYNDISFIRDTNSMAVAILEFTGTFESIEHDEEAIPQWLYCPTVGSEWIKIDLPFQVNPKHRVLEVITLDEDGTQAILLTNSDGFFRTKDNGKTWENINFGEASFIQGDKLKIVVTQSPLYLYVLVDRNQTFSQGENPLFSLRIRNWFGRWRAGLADLLID